MKINTKHVQLELYIEGLQIPLVSVQIQETLNASPSCTINVGVNKLAAFLLLGSIGQVFYYEKGTPILIFEGFLAGTNISKASSTKAVSLFFVGLTSVFDQAWIQSIDYTLDGVVSMDFYVSMSTVLANGKKVDAPDDVRTITPIIKAGDAIANITTAIIQWLDENAKVNGELPESATVSSFIQNILESLMEYNPYLKRIFQTMRVLERVYIFENKASIELLQKVNFINFLNNNNAAFSCCLFSKKAIL